MDLQYKISGFRKVFLLILFFTISNVQCQSLINKKTLHIYGKDQIFNDTITDLKYDVIEKIIINDCPNLILPDYFKYFKNLNTLIIANSDGVELNINMNIIESFKKLESLEITNCNIKDIPSEVFNLGIKNLSFSNNKITHINSDIQNTNLLSLDLSHNPLSKTSLCIISKNNSLEELFISDCELTRFPYMLGKMENLHLLDISENNIVRIKKVTRFNKLEFLFLNHNPLKQKVINFINNPNLIITQ